ncbi:beta-1,4-N-acetylgalactosaminyltransferase bre-4-like [Ornithodoros turicata]|uniref:beta-1,4-N-acetylgalactosaminyltransferase bre-4-like n=1 Tax=Ornithodoros turicata TaxID=34597 RepID=UPI00313A46BF
MKLLEVLFSDVQPGGRWMPKHCVARHRVAVIVPYRDRDSHLRTFLNHMHQLLRKHELDYGIYVVEQMGKGDFNRAKLFNIGFELAKELYDYDCFIFHDVDLLPETDHNIYACTDLPRHMSTCVQKLGYRLVYDSMFGGVSAVGREQMERVNGYSNIYWGWGAEDDDMSRRLRSSGHTIHRYSCSIGRYASLHHTAVEPNSGRATILDKWDSRTRKDGLNSLKYKIVDTVFKKLYTLFQVDVLQGSHFRRSSRSGLTGAPIVPKYRNSSV